MVRSYASKVMVRRQPAGPGAGVEAQALAGGAQALAGPGDQGAGPVRAVAPAPGGVRVGSALAQLRRHGVEQVVDLLGQGADAPLGAAVAQGRGDQHVDADADGGADEDQQHDLAELLDLVGVAGGAGVRGEGEEGGGGDLGALGAQHPPAADDQGDQGHQREGDQVGPGGEAEDGLHGDPGRHRADVPQGLHHGLVDGDLHHQHGGEGGEGG